MTAPLIPGAREPYVASAREPGTMGGAGNGADIRQGGSTMDVATTAEHRKEGGGSAAMMPAGGTR